MTEAFWVQVKVAPHEKRTRRGAILTPTPDAFNQTLMAGPTIVLYEVGIIAARIFGRRRPRALFLGSGRRDRRERVTAA